MRLDYGSSYFCQNGRMQYMPMPLPARTCPQDSRPRIFGDKVTH